MKYIPYLLQAIQPVCPFAGFVALIFKTNLEALHNAIMGDHQDCHSTLCILHILYPEVPNRGPGIGIYSHRMDACTNFFFQVFFSHGLARIFGGISATTPSNI